MADGGIQHRLETACAVARDAGQLALDAFRARPAQLSLTFKGPQDYRTETDAEVERLIRTRLAAAFPDDAFVGEEAGGDPGDDVWVVDPIDGTANFARGIPHFCVSIAFVRKGRPEIGVINQPVTRDLYAARRGGGATLNGRPIRVSGIADMTQATVEAGWSTRRPTQAYIGLVSRLFEMGCQVRRAGSGTLGLADVADGRQDAYCELHINAWDVLAGIVLIGEAGGWVNDFLANDGMSKGNPVLGCTPELSHVLRQAMQM
jgi:myo-inositol-1(or 4)-monophosphatase